MEPHSARHHDHCICDCDQFERIPGLFRRWELEFVLNPGSDYRIEEQGEDAHGTHLFVVFRRATPTNEVTP